MTATTTEQTIDLEKYKIDLGREFGEKFYWDHLNQLSSEGREKLFGYGKNCSLVDLSKQNGQYIASRLLRVCKGLCINPSEILSKHQSKVFRRGIEKKSCEHWIEVSGELKEAVLNKIRDDYDNKS